MRKVVILGFGGNCFDIADLIFELNSINEQYRLLGFLDDNPINANKEYMGYGVLGGLGSISKMQEDVYFINGIGSTRSIFKKKEILENINIEKFLTLVHPSSVISKSAQIGNGTVVLANCTIAANAKLGNHIIVLPNSVVNHDCNVEDYVIIASQVSLSGNVLIGSECYIGTGTLIKENVKVNKKVLIGMGSVVLRDVEEGKIVFGNPAKEKVT